MNKIKYLFHVSDLDRATLLKILNHKLEKKLLIGKSIGLLFEKYSTRTRLSFKVGINQLGGNAIDIKFEEMNISRSESFEDTFRTMACYLDGLVYRTSSHTKLKDSYKYFNKPIINALSDISHPCQIISDLFTLKERFNHLNLNLLWMGDLNNVCYSLIEAVNIIDELNLTICTPENYNLLSIKTLINKNINICHNLKEVNLESLNCVMTDVFTSMNDKKNKSKEDTLRQYQVNESLMSKTSNDCVFMHCLPANVGQEVTKKVIESEKSLIWRQAYNRRIVQNKILQFIDWN